MKICQKLLTAPLRGLALVACASIGTVQAGTPGSHDGVAIAVDAGRPDEIAVHREEHSGRATAAGGAARPAASRAGPARPESARAVRSYDAPRSARAYDSRHRAQPAQSDSLHITRDRGHDYTSVQRITCSSVNHREQHCDMGGHGGRVWLDQQLSGSACVEGRDWGRSGRSIWVDNGCRAVFTVQY